MELLILAAVLDIAPGQFTWFHPPIPDYSQGGFGGIKCASGLTCYGLAQRRLARFVSKLFRLREQLRTHYQLLLGKGQLHVLAAVEMSVP